jgi:hypothetical protein
MAFTLMRAAATTAMLLSAVSSTPLSSAAQQKASYGETVTLPGKVMLDPRERLGSRHSNKQWQQMIHATAEFADGFAVEAISPQSQRFSALRNLSPISGRFVTGATGGPWLAVYPYSFILKPAAAAAAAAAGAAARHEQQQQHEQEEENEVAGER